jgi:hypothetical protein
MAQVVFAVDNFGGRTAWKTGRKWEDATKIDISEISCDGGWWVELVLSCLILGFNVRGLEPLLSEL